MPKDLEKQPAHRHGKGCRSILANMSGFVDGELDPPRRRSLSEHFAGCPSCKAVLQTFKKTIEIFRRKGREKLPTGISEVLRGPLKEKIHRKNAR